MTWNWKHFNKQKTLFKAVYCGECKQRKVCGSLDQEKCCGCYFQAEQEQAQEYSDYQQVYQQKVKNHRTHFQQLLLLKNYSGCSKCGNKEVDAYFLYDENKLVCQPCLMKKEGGSSSPISFLGKQKWYKKRWGIDLTEWLTQFKCSPVNADCAKEWLRGRNHLNNCACLEKGVQNLVELFTSSLQECKEKLKGCKCEKSTKTRTPYYDFANYGYTYCEKCKTKITGAGKHGVIKNRNDPKFWGLEIKEKVLCLNCLEKLQKEMPISKQYTFNKYVKRYQK